MLTLSQSVSHSVTLITSRASCDAKKGENVNNFVKLGHLKRKMLETFCVETNVSLIKVMKWPKSAPLKLFLPCNYKQAVTTGQKMKSKIEKSFEVLTHKSTKSESQTVIINCAE